MEKLPRQYKLGFLISLGVHLGLIALLLLSIETKVRPHQAANAGGEIVQATVVDEKEFSADLKRLEQQALQRKTEQQKRQAELTHKTEQAKKERLLEEKKLLQLKQEETRLAEIKLAQEKEKKQLEVLQLEKVKEQKRLAALEDRRQEDQDRAREMRQAKEKRENDLLAKRKAEEAKKGAALKASEDARMAREQAEWMSGEKDKFDALLIQKINQSWIRPPGLSAGLVCELEAHLLPDGSVVEPRIRASSGNIAFDQAAVAALQKASPLPVPSDPNLMDSFRHFNFKFVPPEET